MQVRNYIVFLAYLSLTAFSRGQAGRLGARPVKPQVVLGSITVAASPSAVSFALNAGGLATGSSPVVITTTYSGVSVLSSFILYAYFATASSALSGGSPVVLIPSSCVLGQMTTGTPTTFTAFTGTGPFGGAGASLQLFSSTALLSLGGSRTDSLSLEINLATIPQLPAGTYIGSLLLTAQAF
jgi:hypothetical protein